MKEIKIGHQIWMSENLNVEKFKNGDLIHEARSNEDWINAAASQQPAWCYFENKNEFGNKFGKLYNFFAVIDKRGLAPDGWSVPGVEEWSELETFLGGANIAGEKMKSEQDWFENRNGSNSSGFNALPGGYRNHKGQFCDISEWAAFWENYIIDDNDEIHAYDRSVCYEDGELTNRQIYFGAGLSVRLLKK
jgi:uncharacterized protein (TIGR02145 family)